MSSLQKKVFSPAGYDAHNSTKNYFPGNVPMSTTCILSDKVFVLQLYNMHIHCHRRCRPGADAHADADTGTGTRGVVDRYMQYTTEKIL